MAKRRGTFSASEIRALRMRLALKLEAFAAELGVSPSTINRWENGTSKPSALAVRALERLNDRTTEPARA